MRACKHHTAASYLTYAIEAPMTHGRALPLWTGHLLKHALITLVTPVTDGTRNKEATALRGNDLQRLCKSYKER